MIGLKNKKNTFLVKLANNQKLTSKEFFFKRPMFYILPFMPISIIFFLMKTIITYTTIENPFILFSFAVLFFISMFFIPLGYVFLILCIRNNNVFIQPKSLKKIFEMTEEFPSIQKKAIKLYKMQGFITYNQKDLLYNYLEEEKKKRTQKEIDDCIEKNFKEL